jgi:hypothetical protein
VAQTRELYQQTFVVGVVWTFALPVTIAAALAAVGLRHVLPDDVLVLFFTAGASFVGAAIIYGLLLAIGGVFLHTFACTREQLRIERELRAIEGLQINA